MSDPPTPSFPAVEKEEWYAGGLRFRCTQCGNCCTGPPGAVWFDEAEGRRMAALLGLDIDAFLSRYAHRIDGKWSLAERKTEHGYDCIFLDRGSADGKAVCAVYDARPMQCRTWPFWEGNLRSLRAWRTAKHRTPCAGMDCGPLIPIERIRILRDALPD